MPGSAHDILVMALRERPYLVAQLLARVSSIPLPEQLTAADTTLRLADVSEVRPDLLFSSPEGDWVMVEVQHRIDPRKRLAWAKAAVLLLTEHGRMGNVVVLTPSRRVASWARDVVRWQSAQGTRLTLTPLVLHLSLADAEQLVSAGDPGLALVAAWTVQKKYGHRAVHLVDRALMVADQQPPPLSEVYAHAILQMLGERWLEQIRNKNMQLSDLPKSEWFERFEKALQEEAKAKGMAEGKAEGKAEGMAEGKAEGMAEGLRLAIMDLCELLGIALSKKRRAHLAGLDLAALEALRAHLKQHRAWPTR